MQRATEGVLGVQGRSVGPGGGAARGEAPSGILIDARKAIKNRFITKLITVRHSGFALGRGSLLRMAVAVCLDLALVFRMLD